MKGAHLRFCLLSTTIRRVEALAWLFLHAIFFFAAFEPFQNSEFAVMVL